MHSLHHSTVSLDAPNHKEVEKSNGDDAIDLHLSSPWFHFVICHGLLMAHHVGMMQRGVETCLQSVFGVVSHLNLSLIHDNTDSWQVVEGEASNTHLQGGILNMLLCSCAVRCVWCQRYRPAVFMTRGAPVHDGWALAHAWLGSPGCWRSQPQLSRCSSSCKQLIVRNNTWGLKSCQIRCRQVTDAGR